MKKILDSNEILYKSKYPNPKIKVGSTVCLAYLSKEEEHSMGSNAYKCWRKLFIVQHIEFSGGDWMYKIRYKSNQKDDYMKKATEHAFFAGRFELVISEFKQLEIL